MIALKRSGDALSALFFFMVTTVVLFSTLLYFAERGEVGVMKFILETGGKGILRRLLRILHGSDKKRNIVKDWRICQEFIYFKKSFITSIAILYASFRRLGRQA